MSIIVDGVLVALIVVFALFGLRRGFLKSLALLAGTMASLFLALTIARPIADWIFFQWMADPIREAISGALSQSGAVTVDGLIAALPDGLRELVGSMGATVGNTFSGSSELIANALTNVLRPLVVNLMMIVIALFIFLVLMIVVRLLTRLLNGVKAIPILRQVNGLLGFLLGAAKGVLIAWLLCILASLVLPLWAAAVPEMTWLKEMTENAYGYQLLCSVNPLRLWLQG